MNDQIKIIEKSGDDYKELKSVKQSKIEGRIFSDKAPLHNYEIQVFSNKTFLCCIPYSSHEKSLFTKDGYFKVLIPHEKLNGVSGLYGKVFHTGNGIYSLCGNPQLATINFEIPENCVDFTVSSDHDVKILELDPDAYFLPKDRSQIPKPSNCEFYTNIVSAAFHNIREVTESQIFDYSNQSIDTIQKASGFKQTFNHDSKTIIEMMLNFVDPKRDIRKTKEGYIFERNFDKYERKKDVDLPNVKIFLKNIEKDGKVVGLDIDVIVLDFKRTEDSKEERFTPDDKGFKAALASVACVFAFLGEVNHLAKGHFVTGWLAFYLIKFLGKNILAEKLRTNLEGVLRINDLAMKIIVAIFGISGLTSKGFRAFLDDYLNEALEDIAPREPLFDGDVFGESNQEIYQGNKEGVDQLFDNNSLAIMKEIEELKYVLRGLGKDVDKASTQTIISLMKDVVANFEYSVIYHDLIHSNQYWLGDLNFVAIGPEKQDPSSGVIKSGMGQSLPSARVQSATIETLIEVDKKDTKRSYMNHPDVPQEFKDPFKEKVRVQKFKKWNVNPDDWASTVEY